MNIPIDRDQLCFYDPGFNPRFTKEADFYTPPKTKNFIIEWFLQIKIQFNILFCCNSNERKLRRKLWRCIKTEALLNEYEFKNSKKKGYVQYLFILEHDLYRSMDKIYHQVIDKKPKRPFPCDLIKPIHTINYSQWGWRDKQNAFKGDSNWQNGDLNRYSSIGLNRLAVDGDVKHTDFIKAVDPTSEELKDQIRIWRAFLYEEAKKLLISGSKLPQDSVEKRLTDVFKAWNNYTYSHEVLEEVQTIFEKNDYYKKHFNHQRKKCITYPSILSKLLWGDKNCEYQLERDLKNEASSLLHDDLKKEFPQHYK